VGVAGSGAVPPPPEMGVDEVMVNAITGLFSLIMVTVFLGYYVIRLNEIPLWIIIGAILIMIFIEYVQSLRGGNQDTNQS
jgi:small-conductance mechanosensitive channel